MLVNVNTARDMLQLPNLLSSEEHQQKLLPTWQHYKAYTSAMASWMKAWVLLLQERWAAGEGACRDTRVPASFSEAPQLWGSSVPEGREQWVVRLLGELHQRIYELLVSSVFDIDWKAAEAAVQGGSDWMAGNCAEAARQKPTSSAIQLVLLMLMTRGVVAAGQLLLGTEGRGGQGTSSNKSVREEGKDKAMASSSSISGSSTGGKIAMTAVSRETRPTPAAARKGEAARAAAAAAAAPVVLGVVSTWHRLLRGRRCSKRRLQ